MADQVKYSTVNLFTYQAETTTKTMVAVDKKVKTYETPFWKQVWESIQYGWNMIAYLFIFIAKFWVVLLGGFLFWIIYKCSKQR